MRDVWGTDGEYEANLREDWAKFQAATPGRSFNSIAAEVGGDIEDVAAALGYRSSTEAYYRMMVRIKGTVENAATEDHFIGWVHVETEGGGVAHCVGIMEDYYEVLTKTWDLTRQMEATCRMLDGDVEVDHARDD